MNDIAQLTVTANKTRKHCHRQQFLGELVEEPLLLQLYSGVAPPRHLVEERVTSLALLVQRAAWVFGNNALRHSVMFRHSGKEHQKSPCNCNLYHNSSLENK